MVNINIPLPTSCASCPLSVRHFGKLYCPPLNDRVGNEGKDSRCPLVDAEGRGDLISREDAVDAISKIKRTDNWQAAVSMALMDLPSAQPKRKTGKWIEFLNHNAYKCSECGRIIETADGKNNVYRHYPYCHCGAKMEVKK